MPIGTAITAARPLSISVPTIAFAMPPPVSPTGVGMCVKKARLSDRMPWLTTKNRTNASGISASSTAPAQKPTNSDDSSLRRLVAVMRLSGRCSGGSRRWRVVSLRAMLQISRRDSELMISVMMKSTSPISTSADR